MRARFFESVLVICALAMSTTAFADVKAYHGAFCATSSSGDEQWLARESTGIRNASNLLDPHTVIVTCPLIRDRIGSASNISSVVVEAMNFDGTLACTLRSQSEDIGGGTVGTQTQTTSTTGNVQLPSFSVATSSGNEGAYSIRCTLGPSDTIYHVFVEELNGSD